VATSLMLLLNVWALIGIAWQYGPVVAVCGFLVFPIVFVAYPFATWYYTGQFPFVFFGLWGFSLFAAYKAYTATMRSRSNPLS
jgi:hypothetical protein